MGRKKNNKTDGAGEFDKSKIINHIVSGLVAGIDIEIINEDRGEVPEELWLQCAKEAQKTVEEKHGGNPPAADPPDDSDPKTETPDDDIDELPKEKEFEPEPEVFEPGTPKWSELSNMFPRVDHKPASCPNCSTTKSKITGTRRVEPHIIQRVHHCQNPDCLIRFGSIQTLSRTDVQLYGPESDMSTT